MTNDKKLFYEELNKLILDPKIHRLSDFPQHNGSNTLAHCVQVAKRSFELAELFGWDIDEKELARGAMLHDYYQYNIKGKRRRRTLILQIKSSISSGGTCGL